MRKENKKSTTIPILVSFFGIITILGAIYWGLLITGKIPEKESQKQICQPNKQEIISELTGKLDAKQKAENARKIQKWILENYYRTYPRLAKTISEYLVNESKIPLLMIGLVAAESSFIVQNKSSVNAYGLGQIRYSLWKKEAKQFGINSVNDIFDPVKNLKLSEYILLKYLKQTGNLKEALSLYQTGKLLAKLKPKQRIRTKKYINKVLSICGNIYASINLSYQLAKR